MENKKRKLRILNPAELAPITGGNSISCNKTGDTIICSMIADLTVCVSFEAKCPSGFSSDCSLSSNITIICPSGFTVGRKN